MSPTLANSFLLSTSNELIQVSSAVMIPLPLSRFPAAAFTTSSVIRMSSPFRPRRTYHSPGSLLLPSPLPLSFPSNKGGLDIESSTPSSDKINIAFFYIPLSPVFTLIASKHCKPSKLFSIDLKGCTYDVGTAQKFVGILCFRIP